MFVFGAVIGLAIMAGDLRRPAGEGCDRTVSRNCSMTRDRTMSRNRTMSNDQALGYRAALGEDPTQMPTRQ